MTEFPYHHPPQTSRNWRQVEEDLDAPSSPRFSNHSRPLELLMHENKPSSQYWHGEPPSPTFQEESSLIVATSQNRSEGNPTREFRNMFAEEDGSFLQSRTMRETADDLLMELDEDDDGGEEDDEDGEMMFEGSSSHHTTVASPSHKDGAAATPLLVAPQVTPALTPSSPGTSSTNPMVGNHPGGTNKQQKAPNRRGRLRRLQKLQQPRRNPAVDRILTLLEDKRITDAAELYKLQDLQMPRLRKALNAIFILLGISFLLAVLGVIGYSSFVTPPP